MAVWFDTAGLSLPSPPAGALPSLPGWAARASMTKATLDLYEPNPNATGTPGSHITTITFQFNPKDLTLAKTAKWDSKPVPGSSSTGPVQFIGPEPSSLSLELFLDASDKLDDSVVKAIEQLAGSVIPTATSNPPSPPWVQFSWGPAKSFLGYVASVSAKCTLFTSAGMPVRATVSLALKELPSSQPGQNPTSGTREPRRVHITSEGDTLAYLAFREYGDPGAWRAIAEANGIDNPMRLRAGTRLLLPARKELAELAPQPERQTALTSGVPGG